MSFFRNGSIKKHIKNSFADNQPRNQFLETVFPSASGDVLYEAIRTQLPPKIGFLETVEVEEFLEVVGNFTTSRN